MTYGERLRFVAPNLITATGLSFGLMAIFRCLAGDPMAAAWWIVWCVLIDKLDGAVARRLHATSAFGVQMDSLSDLVTFGVAPAVLAVCVTGDAGGTLVRAAAAAYAVAAALRLARFNVAAAEDDGDLFEGLPTTFCGGLVAVSALVATRHGWSEMWATGAPLLLALLALLMVSRMPVPKLKRRRSRLVNAFTLANLAAAYVLGFLRMWPEYHLALIVVYFIGGAIYVLVFRRRAQQASF